MCKDQIDQNNINIPDECIKFEINDQLFLETLLLMIRGNSIKFSSIKKKKKQEEENKLEHEIKILEEEINTNLRNINEDTLREFDQKKTRLTEIRDEKIEGVLLRSRSRYQDLGEKPTSYFLHLENRNFTSKVINKLVDENGFENTETKNILDCQRNFYINLYDDAILVDDTPIESILGENKYKLCAHEAEIIEGEITCLELANALKNMKNNKSPGLDGFTTEFFKFFWTDIGIFIHRSINYGYRTGSLSITQKQRIITCIPKPNKSRENLKNWRPISLLNVIYKMASAVISNRIKSVLQKLIHEDQKGFIAGRFIGENIRLIYDVLFETKKSKPSRLVFIY